MAEVMGIPVGYRLKPTEVELIDYFLKRKMMGQQIDARIIEKSMYGENANPWDVIKDDDPWEDLDDSAMTKVIYVFCKLIMKNGKSRVVRTAGCGTWDGKAVSHKIRNSKGKIIGQKRSITFKAKKEFESEMKGRGRWIMHEFSLLDYGNCQEEYVICRITKELLKGICPQKAVSRNVTMDNDDSWDVVQKKDDGDGFQKKVMAVVLDEPGESQEINSNSSSKNVSENEEIFPYTLQPLVSVGLDGIVTRNLEANCSMVVSMNCKENEDGDIIPCSAQN